MVLPRRQSFMLPDIAARWNVTMADFGGIPLNIEAMGNVNIEFIRSGSNASGSLTITNLVANGASIPAPGAIALLGAAGLIGGRRRRA